MARPSVQPEPPIIVSEWDAEAGRDTGGFVESYEDDTHDPLDTNSGTSQPPTDPSWFNRAAEEFKYQVFGAYDFLRDSFHSPANILEDPPLVAALVPDAEGDMERGEILQAFDREGLPPHIRRAALQLGTDLKADNLGIATLFENFAAIKGFHRYARLAYEGIRDVRGPVADREGFKALRDIVQDEISEGDGDPDGYLEQMTDVCDEGVASNSFDVRRHTRRAERAAWREYSSSQPMTRTGLAIKLSVRGLLAAGLVYGGMQIERWSAGNAPIEPVSSGWTASDGEVTADVEPTPTGLEATNSQATE